MFNRFLKKMVDFNRSDSLISEIRSERMKFFKELLDLVRKPVRILDIGGTELFWEKSGYSNSRDVEITLLNVFEIRPESSNIASIVGDGRDLSEFSDGEFDIVFSNSVIEHVGDFEDQKRMASEMRRVGKRFFLQTPNFNFPVEPHFLFPFFQFLPVELRILLLRNFNLGWYSRTTEYDTARKIVTSIHLLKEREIRELFPDASIKKEMLFGMVYSFLVYDGFESGQV